MKSAEGVVLELNYVVIFSILSIIKPPNKNRESI